MISALCKNVVEYQLLINLLSWLLNKLKDQFSVKPHVSMVEVSGFVTIMRYCN